MKRALILVLLAVGVGCGGDDNPGTDGPKDAGIDSPLDASCFENPTTHYEIINACTTAQKIYKDSNPPLLQPDGTLPPLPP